MNTRAMIAETMTLKGHNRDKIEAHYARPLGPGPFPGMVIVHYIAGLDDWNQEFARTFAYHGYATVAPNLYSRFGRGSPDTETGLS